MGEELGRKSGCSWLQIVTATVTASCLIAATMPVIKYYASRRNFVVTVSNCREVMACLKRYSSDQGGRYPDADSVHPVSANQAFRVLFREGYIQDEHIFGAGTSPFRSDGKIGNPPDYPRALLAGENHWAMTKGLKEGDDGTIPLAFENPSVVGWPPMWNVDEAGKAVRGRVWPSGLVVCGFHDGTVAGIKMSESKGTKVLPSKEGGPRCVFTNLANHMEILDVEP